MPARQYYGAARISRVARPLFWLHRQSNSRIGRARFVMRNRARSAPLRPTARRKSAKSPRPCIAGHAAGIKSLNVVTTNFALRAYYSRGERAYSASCSGDVHSKVRRSTCDCYLNFGVALPVKDKTKARVNARRASVKQIVITSKSSRMAIHVVRSIEIGGVGDRRFRCRFDIDAQR